MAKTTKKNKVRVEIEGQAHIQASFNNIIISLTNNNGQVISWSSAGKMGFRGSKKNTPYAAQMAAESAAEKARSFGFEKADVYVTGVGHGREQALRGLIAQGIAIKAIYDITPVPHNGCRQPRVRRN